MNARVRILVGMAVWNMLVSASWAQLTDPEYVNLPEKAWEAKYDREQQGQPNKNGDKAIQVVIGTDAMSQDTVVKLFRYSRINTSEGVYKLRQNGGKLTLPIAPLPNGNTSKRKSFTTEPVEYDVPGGKKREVTVKGWWHPGPGRNRDDHRLSIRIIDQEVKAAQAVATDPKKATFSPDCCEDEPDTDILAEVPLILDPITELPPPLIYP